jgi:hypothetical protein
MSSVVTIKGRAPVTVTTEVEELDRLLFTTTAEKVMVPTPNGKAVWLPVNRVLSVEPVGGWQR